MTAISSTEIEVIAYLCAAVSSIACLSVICCYYFVPQVRTFVTRIIFYLAVAELFSSLSRYVQDCEVFAALSQFGNLSSLCWMASVAIVQYLTVVKHHRLLYKYEWCFHLFNWGFPLLDTIIIGVTDNYGEAGIWCWIKADATYSRWIGYFLFLFLVMIVLFACFGGIVFVLEHRLTSSLMPSASLSHQNSKQFQREIVLYLTVVVAVKIWAVMDRLYDLVSENGAPSLIKDLHAMGTCLEGFINCLLLFFNNRTLRQRLMVGASEKWRLYQQTRDVKSLTETESLFQRDDTSVQGYSVLSGAAAGAGAGAGAGGQEQSRSESTVSATMFVTKGVRDYKELFPHWSEDYLIDAKQDVVSRSMRAQQHSQHAAPKSAKLLQSFRVHLATWDSSGSTLYIDDYGSWLPSDASRRASTFQANAPEQKQDSTSSSRTGGTSASSAAGVDGVNKELPELVGVATQRLGLSAVAWEQRLQQQMGSGQYSKVVTHQLRDLHFVLYVRKDVKHYVANTQIASTGRTYERFFGNKGGLAVAIEFAGMKIGFVGIDLMNENECDMHTKARDIQGIAHGLWLERPEIDFNHQFNALFWLGNLNSCIEDGKDHLEDIVALSEEERKDIEDMDNFNQDMRDSVTQAELGPNVHKYYSQDQCFLLRKQGKILHQNHEIDIKFNPTYALRRDHQQIERYDRSRTPRWCSRILYGIPPNPMIEVSPQAYNSVNQLFGSSNHRAVYANFLLNRYNAWFPIPQTCWKFYLKGFQIVLNKRQISEDASNIRDESDVAAMLYAPPVRNYNTLYLTIHAPFLDDTLRTPLAKVVQETADSVVLSIPSRVDFEKLFDDHDVRQMGNFCVYIVVRDENLLGDMDGIAACSVPLLYDEDVNRNVSKEAKLMMNNDKNDDAAAVALNIDADDENAKDVPLDSVDKATYYRFQSALTCDTSKRGRVEGLIAMRQKEVVQKK